MRGLRTRQNEYVLTFHLPVPVTYMRGWSRWINYINPIVSRQHNTGCHMIDYHFSRDMALKRS